MEVFGELQLQDATAYIQRNRMILGSISVVLLLTGLTNYFNVVITGVFEKSGNGF
ncbi:hypothetical protein [Lachnoclostridium sp. An196]|uniref:hypothetical protein n=1 Tax=Lachnoclostridium sp. An196 TaxID=1965583 RepID=UPI0013A66E30|nr:hypothetical protein [Lachnoclostridium sp. An196]